MNAQGCWFVGLTTLDVIHRVEAFPLPNRKATATAQSVRAGGPAANAAATAAALGTGALLITAAGDGPAARIARADLAAAGVTIVDAAPAHDLSVSSIIIEPGGDRTIISTDAAHPAIRLPDLDALPRPAALLLDGHHPDLQLHALQWATRNSVPIVVDAGRWRPVFAQILPKATVVACSADFHLPGAPDPADRDLARAILALGASAVVITHGADPVYLADREGEATVPVPRVDTVDTLGAGDAFHGALTASIARDQGLPAAVSQAIVVASEKVARLGR